MRERAVSPTWPPVPVAVLTPVLPGHELSLAGHLEDLDAATSPFTPLSSTHRARLVVVGQVRTIAGMKRVRRPLRMRYLLFTAVANCPVEDFLEELRSRSGPEVDAVWEHCVGYPGHRNARLFHSYMKHNLIEAEQSFSAYDATVPEVREGLELRRRHLAFAMQTQGRRDADLRSEFLRFFDIDDGRGSK